MSNMMLAWPNRGDTSALDQGSWVPSLPLSNLLNEVLGIKARSTDAAVASTKFRSTLAMDYDVRVVTLANHNFSATARYRIRGGMSPSMATVLYDSGWTDVYGGGVNWDDPATWLEWEDDGFWLGGVLSEEVEGYRATLVHILPTTIKAKYWLIEIDDQANQAGYIEIGRFHIAPVWQPVRNLAYGAGIEWVSRSNVAEAAGGAEYFERRQAYRVFKGQLNTMTTSEAMGKAYEWQRRMDVTEQFVFIYDPTDTEHRRRRAFLSRIRQLTPIEHPYYNNHTMAIEIKEIL